MRRSTVFPAIAVFLAVFAVAAAGFVASRVKGGSGGDAITTMAERWLRDDATSGVEVYPGIMPPVLDQILNAGVTNPADRMSLPVHPQARLLGSSYIHQSDGTDLVWLMYDVEGDLAAVSQAVAAQLNASPWQVNGGLAESTQRVVRFQNNRLADVEGSVVVRLDPNAPDYRLTVSRGGAETTLHVKMTALTPTLGGATEQNLTVTRVDPGPAQEAGLKKGDRIVRVNDTAVKSPPELGAALQSAANTGTPRSALTYILASRAQDTEAAPASAYVPPAKPLTLPEKFPAPQAWQGLSVVRYAWGQQQGATAYQASMISKDGAPAVAGRVRDGLKAAGWQITNDTAVGFATQLQIANATDGLAGQVSIDEYPEDSAYVEVIVQIQSGQSAGRP
ncbi:MAG: PDZ domain-containing protein [Dehalococcoidia bacterium]